MKGLYDILGGILLAIILFVTFFLYCLATPDQLSAECEWQKAHPPKSISSAPACGGESL